MRHNNQIIDEIVKVLKTGMYVKDAVQDFTGKKEVEL